MTETAQNTGELVSQDFDLMVVTDPSSAEWKLAFDIEAPVFIEKGYVADAGELAEEYRPYLEHSFFLLATSADEAVGSVRCITPGGPAGFKTLHDIAKDRLVLSEEGAAALDLVPSSVMMEIGTLAVPQDYRSRDDGRVASQLYGAIFGVMKPRGLTHVIASFDEKYFNNFKQIFGETVTAIGPPVEYMGSKTVPALMNVYDMHERTRELSQELYDTIQRASERVK